MNEQFLFSNSVYPETIMKMNMFLQIIMVKNDLLQNESKMYAIANNTVHFLPQQVVVNLSTTKCAYYGFIYKNCICHEYETDTAYFKR